VFGAATPVKDAQNLWAYEIDTKETIEKSKKEIREKIQWFLKFADISTKADDFVESATMNPAFEESAMFENMVDLMLKDEYDVIVFDTAPTANARRLLGMSKVYSLWVDKMLKSREEARTLREMLSFSKKKEADPLLTYLLQFRERMGQARGRLTDVEKTAFFCYASRGAADRRHQPVHRLVPRLRNPRRRRHRQHAFGPAGAGGWRAAICPQSGSDATGTHEDRLEQIRRLGARRNPALRPRGPRAGDASRSRPVAVR
jgi:hypothetical protein